MKVPKHKIFNYTARYYTPDSQKRLVIRRKPLFHKGVVGAFKKNGYRLNPRSTWRHKGEKIILITGMFVLVCAMYLHANNPYLAIVFGLILFVLLIGLIRLNNRL